jgi:hypothetical protein
MALSNAEKETVIRYDKESNLATVYTHEVRIINRLKREMKRLEKEGGRLVCEEKFEGTPSATFEVPIKWIKVSPPKQMKNKSAKEKE